MKTFSIIGMGFSGNSVFCQLVESLIYQGEAQGCQINLFERSENYLATGVAYHFETPAIWTLNIEAQHFWLTDACINLKTWMAENTAQWQALFPLASEEFPPRALAGLYLKAQFEKHLQLARQNGIIVTLCHDEIMDLNQCGQQWEILTDNQKKYISDNAFLCLGNPASTTFADLQNYPGFVNYPFDIKQLQLIPKKSTVYVIGGQTSFIDSALFLGHIHPMAKIFSVTRNRNIITSKGHELAIPNQPLRDLAQQLRSRSTELTFAEGKALFWQTYKASDRNHVNPDNLPSTLQALKYRFQTNSSAPALDGNIETLRIFIRKFYFDGCYTEFWKSLNPQGKTEFLKQMYSLLLSFSVGTNPLNGRLLLELYEKNIIEELVGLQTITYDEATGKFILSFNDGATHQADYVVNATGLACHVADYAKTIPLVAKLLQKGYITAQPYGGIVTDEANQAQPGLFCIGPLTASGKIPTPFSSHHATIQARTSIAKLELNSRKATLTLH